MTPKESKWLMDQWHSPAYRVTAYRSMDYCAVEVTDKITGKHVTCSLYQSALENFREALKSLKSEDARQ